MWLLVLAVVAGTVVEGNWWSWTKGMATHLAIEAMGFDDSGKCAWTRNDALHCIGTYVDTNHDTEISQSEFEHAKHAYLPKQARFAMLFANYIGYDVKFKDVLSGCDVNKDGKLTLWDWEHGSKSCLPGQSDLCKLKTVCDIAEHQMNQHSRY